MPLALLLIGTLFLTASVRGNKCGGQQCSDVLFSTMKDDFTGPNNFIYWGISLFVIGAVGYYKPLKPLSNAFLGLVIIVLLLSNRGFFQSFFYQIGTTRNDPNSFQNNKFVISDPVTAVKRIVEEMKGFTNG